MPWDEKTYDTTGPEKNWETDVYAAGFDLSSIQKPPVVYDIAFGENELLPVSNNQTAFWSQAVYDLGGATDFEPIGTRHIKAKNK